MVKYMFREDLGIAKAKFAEQARDKEAYKLMPKPGDVQAMLGELVEQTLDAYGNVGIYDPQVVPRLEFAALSGLGLRPLRDSNRAPFASCTAALSRIELLPFRTFANR
eukprot:4504436-Prymnesium_polylepis.1